MPPFHNVYSLGQEGEKDPQQNKLWVRREREPGAVLGGGETATLKGLIWFSPASMGSRCHLVVSDNFHLLDPGYCVSHLEVSESFSGRQ